MKIDSYLPNEKTNFIFINCSISDEKVTVVANITRHDEDTELKENDVVKFVDVIRVKPKKANLGLKVEKNTKIYLLSRAGQRLDVPKEMLKYKFIEKKKKEAKSANCKGWSYTYKY